ncbi:MAG: RecX family transcriptional regulator [Bacteroidetes bacterium]|nr:RecX family transcriptional regulator [Bacteroidota bacterium]MBS1628543.1 RecX family transcriptional regulator [Bacteroidota bacterium]
MGLPTAIIRFCQYQERSQQEVRDRLYLLGFHQDSVEYLISELIKLDLINEQRFALAYARGKFRIKHWGKQKIIQGLKRHRISEYLQKKALQEIDLNEYFATALHLATKKWEQIEGSLNRPLPAQQKLRSYLLQKGYESTLIRELLTIILTDASS